MRDCDWKELTKLCELSGPLCRWNKSAPPRVLITFSSNFFIPWSWKGVSARAPPPYDEFLSLLGSYYEQSTRGNWLFHSFFLRYSNRKAFPFNKWILVSDDKSPGRDNITIQQLLTRRYSIQSTQRRPFEISVIDFYVNFIPIKRDRVALSPDGSLHKMDRLMAARIKIPTDVEMNLNAHAEKWWHRTVNPLTVQRLRRDKSSDATESLRSRGIYIALHLKQLPLLTTEGCFMEMVGWGTGRGLSRNGYLVLYKILLIQER